MTDDEARALLAERVMGWHLRGHGGDRWWFDKDVLRAMRSDEWHPEEILEQAMMVAETLRLQHGWEYEVGAKTPYQRSWTLNHEDISCRFNWFGRNAEEFRTRQIHYIYKANADTLERAIFMAAAQVAEAMDEKE